MLHADRLINVKGERVAVMEMHKYVACYLKGLKGNGNVRARINHVEIR